MQTGITYDYYIICNEIQIASMQLGLVTKNRKMLTDEKGDRKTEKGDGHFF
jgi:hypothetical protein